MGRHLALKPIIIIILIILFTVFGMYYFGVFKKNCDQDIGCFNNALSECKRAKFEGISNENFYRYTIIGASGNKCVVDIELKKTSFGTKVDVVKRFEGKGMKCSIPDTQLDSIDISQFKNLINYCTGPLKEAILEQIVSKMYSLIVQNLGEIIDKVERDLYKIS